MPDEGKPGRPRGRPFEKGRSGNPKGRPRKRREPMPSAIDLVIGRLVPMPGEEEPLSIAAAVRRRTFQDALEGKARAMRQVLGWLLQWEERGGDRSLPQDAQVSILKEMDPRNLDRALQLLDIVQVDETRQGDRHAPHLLVREWAVKAALSRRGRRSALDDKDWAAIRRCTEPGAEIEVRPSRRSS